MNKYDCPHCDGEGSIEIDSPEGDYTTACTKCGSTGKRRVNILLEEYERLQQENEMKQTHIALLQKGNKAWQECGEKYRRVLVQAREALEGVCDYCNIPCSICKTKAALATIENALGVSDGE
jgi:Na+-transporting NADH:ubiquinone oxidoreductase subunit NqrF